MKAKKTKQKHYPPLVGIVVIAVLALIVAVLARHGTKDTGTNDAALVKHDAAVTVEPKTGETVPKAKNAISVSDQKAGASVDIDQVSLQQPGYVVLYDDAKGQPGKMLTHSGLIGAGTKQDLIIKYATKAGATYHAVLHDDNGDSKFDAAKDQALIGANALPIQAKFMAVK